MKTYNKSRTYLLPLIDARINLNINYIRNTYLHTYEDFEHFRLHVKHEFNTIEEVEEYEAHITKSPLYVRKLNVDTNDDKITIIYSFNLDNDFRSTYVLFTKGMYSKISNVDQNMIKSFWNRIYGRTNKQFVLKIKNILDKSNILKKELEEQLAVELPADAELSSIINYDDEIYYGD